MRTCICFLFLLLADAARCFSLSSLPILSTVTATAPPQTAVNGETLELKSIVKSVTVVGATGRTGQLVVQQLLDQGVNEIVAVVRNEQKAESVFADSTKRLRIVQADLTQPLDDTLQGTDAVIWCATGFSDNPATQWFDKLKGLLGMALTPKQSIDAIALPNIAEAMSKNKREQSDKSTIPQIVMCSSAGVTRTIWDEDKKKRLEGAADIPIVRLNPFGILDVKRESEEKLREVCNEKEIAYTILRPAGLNDKWPAGSRPLFSQGDVAAGRTNRRDLARVLIQILTTPAAVGKTFEMVTVAGYPPATSLDTALSRLRLDADGPLPEEIVSATYSAMQQLLPGEQQDSAGLAMGQTYEEMDRGKTGRLGERGQEDAESAAPKPSS